MNDLSSLRATVSRAMTIMLWLHIPLIAGVAWGLSTDWEFPLFWATMLATATTIGLRFMAPATGRLTMAVALIAMVSLVLAVCRGTGWQLDAHLYYFAALAMLAAYCDRDVILATAGVTALHHLTLDFIAPELVFPDGAQFDRVLVHAAIVVLEAGSLIWMTHQIVRLFSLSARHLADAVAASAAARQLDAEAAAQRQIAAQIRAEHDAAQAIELAAQAAVVTSMAARLEALASGDLTIALDHAFPAPYEKLRSNFNGAVAQQNAAMVEESTAASHALAERTDALSALTGRFRLDHRPSRVKAA